MNNVDICIIGGGPAGLTAAAFAAEHGLTVALMDERPSGGGQIYRGVVDGPLRNDPAWSADYDAGRAILHRFDAARSQAFFGATIWRIDLSGPGEGGFVSFSTGGRSERLGFSRLILATGAIERPVAFEGWTLPGVMPVGGAQLLLKGAGVVPKGRLVLAGNGPLLLLFACQLIGLGVPISAILDTAPPASRLAIGMRHARSLFSNRDKIARGARMIRAIRRAGIPVVTDVSGLEASGDDRLAAIRFEAGDRSKTLDADVLLVHEGIIPNTHLASALGCRMVWDDAQHCLRPELDRHGQTSDPNVFIVGDGASIDGAIAAPASATIAVGRILDLMGRADRRSAEATAAAMALFARERGFRGFLNALYPPRIAAAPCSDATIVCRCEEVTAANLRNAVADGAQGPAQAKAYTRSGMGACQGRMCGPIVSQLIARETGRKPGDVAGYTVRFPLKPITLAEIAALSDAQARDDQHAH